MYKLLWMFFGLMNASAVGGKKRGREVGQTRGQ